MLLSLQRIQHFAQVLLLSPFRLLLVSSRSSKSLLLVRMVTRAAIFFVRSDGLLCLGEHWVIHCTARCFNNFLCTYQFVTNFPTHMLSTWLPNQLPPTPFVLQTKPRYHDVSFLTRARGVDPKQPQRSRSVCHRATQLKLAGVESKKHNCGL